MESNRKWTVAIMDIYHINHIYRFNAKDKKDAFDKLKEFWRTYGKPYDIEKHGYIFADAWEYEPNDI